MSKISSFFLWSILLFTLPLHAWQESTPVPTLDSEIEPLELPGLGHPSVPLLAEASGGEQRPAQQPPALVPALPQTAEQKHTGVDAKFITLQALSWGMMVADYEITLHKLRDGRFEEGNFLYGKNPTRARLYAIGVPVNGALTYLSYRMKKKGSSGWLALPLLHIGARGFAVGYNLSLDPK